MTIAKMRFTREHFRLRCQVDVLCCPASVFLHAALYLIAKINSVGQLLPQ